ncbi:diacylglycerol kinase family protein [Priestia endophytica]|uniref:diacylglycerol kinase family protein n=1 Tax=Priestia endophytica TaxID=135735 RepID=UPI00077CA645|nr:diacylglycerol kinase family protein [Priestia endophytica]KYG36114.1 UDP kinase [Priestia endophytica]
MGLHDKHSFLKSFSYAFSGIKTSFQSELHLKIHSFAGVLALGSGFYFQITQIEWIVIILLIMGMFSLEMMNTAIEKTVDLVTRDYHHLAKKAKDIAAGAVLVYAIGAMVIGIIIFWPYLGI